jgi:tetratricopeptide (TPR) repeat protein
MRHDTIPNLRQPELSVLLLGMGAITIAGAKIPPRSSKTLALLAYLAVEADRPHRREKLAGLLWPNALPGAARHSLRQALHHLRTVANGALAQALDIGEDWVRFVRCPHVFVDVQRFVALVSTPGAANRRRAAALYCAQLLDGRSYDGCDEFEDWLESTRMRLHRMALANVEGIALSPGLIPASGSPSMAKTDPERVDALASAARAAEQVHAFGHALTLYQQALGALDCDPEANALRFDLLLRLEAVLDRLGRRQDQVQVIQKSASEAKRLDDTGRMALALLREASILAYLDESDQARSAASRALAQFRDLGDKAGEAEALRELGFAAWKAGDFGAALDCTRGALERHRRLGDTAGEASALHNLAEIYRGLGDARRALQWFSQAMELHWVSGSRRGEILSLFGIGHCWQQLGDESRACQHYETALTLCEQHGEPTMKARILYALAGLSRRRNELDDSLRLMRRTIEIDRSLNFAHALGHDLVGLAQVHLARGERFEAQAALREASIWFEGVANDGGLTATKSMLAAVAAGQAAITDAQVIEAGRRGIWVRSHLPLSEGKVYCEFESNQLGASPVRTDVLPHRTSQP